MIPLIEEKMRLMAKEERPIQHLEMVPKIAAGFLTHLGQTSRAQEALQSQEQLLHLVQIGDFADLSPSSPITSDVGYFKLQEIDQEGDKRSLVAFAFPSKEELKQFMKEYQPASSKDRLAEYLDGGIWLPKGEALRHKLLGEWQKALEDFCFVSTPHHTLQEYQKVGRSVAEIFYEGGYRDRAHVFYSALELPSVCNSCLQIVVKFLTMLGFDFEMILQENLVEFQLFDMWGRPWIGPFVKVETKAVVMSLFGQMEQFVMLYLEREKL